MSPSATHHPANGHHTSTNGAVNTNASSLAPNASATASTAPAALTKTAIEATADSQATPHAPANNWDTPGPAAYDLRSDTITTPTASMLRSIAACTLLDDVFLEDPTVAGLQTMVAELTGFEDALLVTSGTQGNQIALRAALDCAPPYSVVLDARSHIYGWEAGGAGWITGALMKTVMPENGHHLTVGDVEKNVVISDDVHYANTRLVCLENTLAGTVMPLEECKRIQAWCKEKKIHLHCDGARLWEAAAATSSGSDEKALRKRLLEYAGCFDSISLCFSKGLGAPIGSALVGSKALIKRSRAIRKAMGGGMRQAGILAAPMRTCIEETFLGGQLAATHTRAKEFARIWEQEAGGKQQEGKLVETNMVWCDLASAGTNVEGFVRTCKEEGLRVMGGRLVIHYQIADDAVDKWHRVCKKLGAGAGKRANGEVDEHGMGKEAKKMKLEVE